MRNLKKWILTKSVSIFLILGFLIQPAIAEQGIFLNISTAKKLASTLEFNQKLLNNQQTIIDNITIENIELNKKSIEQTNKIEGLVQDRTSLQSRGDKFEKQYTNCNEDFQIVKDSMPSRYTWFSTGFVSAMILGLVGLFFLK